MGKTPSPILNRLWTKVREILGQCRGPLVVSNALAQLSTSRFVQKIFAIKSRSGRKPKKYKVLAPNFWEGRPRLFYGLVRFIFPPFGGVWLSSVQRVRVADE